MGRNVLKILLLLCCMLRPHVGQLIQDKRCFLENGATAAHLFVSEDLPVGGIVGVLGVVGDPGLQGDIELSLQEHDSPVAFSSYSKNLTLIRPLDKEGIEGPASVYINVICEKKHTLDPGFIIPVNIRVTDANDNSPQFINAPYVLNISEVTVLGTRVLQGVRAVDADQPGPYSTVQYAVLPGTYSDYFVFVNALEGTLVLRKSLDYETLTNFSVGIRAQDQGSPPRSSTTTLYVNVIDADDQNPAFLNDQYKVAVPRHVKGDYQTSVPEDTPSGSVLLTAGVNKIDPNSGSLPIAARAAPAWLGNSVLLVAIFGAVLGLLGVVILILILYIYKHKRPKSGGSVSSVGTGYREKSPVPSALSPMPQVLGANVLQDVMEGSRNRPRDNDSNENDNDSRNDIDNPVFGETHENSYGALYARHKVAPAPNPPTLSATSNIPNIGGLVQNMNDLSARTNLDAGSHNSSNYSGDPPDSLVPAWPANSALPRIKKLSWDDDDRTVDSVEVAAETRTGDDQAGNERLNLTVYF